MPPEPPGLDEDLPGLHPEPPADFASRELPFLLMEGAFFRIHQLQHGALYELALKCGRASIRWFQLRLLGHVCPNVRFLAITCWASDCSRAH
jgi:hypothetical protein